MIYFDNAATTPISKNVKTAIVNALDIYGNPSSQYDLGKQSKNIITDCRHRIERALSLAQDTIIFTGSGSEADTFAIQAGWWHGMKRGRNKIIISSIEHHAITHAAEQLKRFGAVVEYVKVNKNGNVDLDDLREKVDYNTAIVSIMASNNEVGTSNNLYSISRIAHDNGALFHTDAVQGITHLYIDGNIVDLMSIAGHKFGAPKGIGIIYINPFIKEEMGE